MLHVLLLSNQLFNVQFLKRYFKNEIVIVVYEPVSFYHINHKHATDVKKKYFRDCLTNYLKETKAKLIHKLDDLSQTEYHYFDFLDFTIESQITRVAKTNFIKHDSPMFLLNSLQRDSYAKDKATFLFASFYKHFRQELGIFAKPIGGKWSYDEENQKPLTNEVYNAFSEIKDINFPTTRKDAIQSLRTFIKNKLSVFGPLQDIIIDKNSVVNHSCISMVLNMGLIFPHEVIKLLPDGNKWSNKTRASIEGFLRQLFWREYMAVIYRAKLPVKNIFGSKVKLPNSWFELRDKITGNTLVDTKIAQAIKFGYLNHIERLMLVGNFMLLAQFDPDDVYTWFMCCFVDAHDWVMVGNVYHMLLYASGKTVVTRPYIASSTYLKKQAKMSPEDCAMWDAVYSRFVLKQSKLLRHMYMTTGHIKKAKLIDKEK